MRPARLEHPLLVSHLGYRSFSTEFDAVRFFVYLYPADWDAPADGTRCSLASGPCRFGMTQLSLKLV
jgi:hypothetical protein